MPSTRPLPSSRRRPAYERPRYRQMQPVPHWRRELDADLAAMGKVWQMIRTGATRMLGEIGRQY
ncbi:hypothetical protein [Synechococcus sp. W4D4]|jgi:2-polyprenyl-6-methoxyphenol hydroxylase-like FAD-dependent oxidoreductase|uniref:hypothetical protein n=1 Tax=Synechococcus sp. W4D4 TaxID=3392294 RepID=UPI0039EC2FEC